MKNLWHNLSKPIVGLSPMDGYTDSAFRRVCKLVNPDIVLYTEFTSADGISHGADKLMRKLSFHSDEHPIVAQIFGKDEKTFIEAAKVVEGMGFDGIDINMGCPSKKVVKSEHGVAIRKKPEKAFQMVAAVVGATRLPVSVKTRLGWSNAEDLIDFGKGVEAAGASQIAVHARTYTIPYASEPDYEPVFVLKEELSIPVLGNGSVSSLKNGRERISRNGERILDGYLIGRASFGNPWVFTESGSPPDKFSDRVDIIQKHAEFLIVLKGERVGTQEIRKHLLQYVKGIEGAKNYRKELVGVESLEAIYGVLEKIGG